jgi:FkbM family methyltransferase
MKYSIVIPTYNHLEDCLKPCVESLLKYSNIKDIELIISANGCTDGTSDYVNDLIRKFNYLGLENHIKHAWSDEPLGYAKATNAGIKLATTNHIVLLNNDVVFVEQPKNRWLELFQAQFDQDPKCGISCVVKGPSDPAGHDFAIFFIVMIHRKVFDKIGLITEEYGVGGHEDTEFSIETERAGFTIREAVVKHWRPEIGMHVGDFPVYHKGEATVHDATLVPDWNNIFFQNSLKIAKKYNPSWYEAKMKELGIVEKPTTPQEEFRWMKDTPEFVSMYDEVIGTNGYRLLPEHIQGRSVIDIGANIGCFSVLACSMGAKKVLAVEPISKTFDTFRTIINRSGYKNIKPIKFAVTSVAEEYVKIPIQPDPGHTSLFKEGENFEIIETITLRDLISKIDDTGIFLKIDCEGGEYDILMNADPEDMKKIDVVVLEIHADLHPTYKGFEILHKKFEEFGYTKYHEDQIFYITYDAHGNAVNYQPIPFKQESWSRIPMRRWNT